MIFIKYTSIICCLFSGDTYLFLVFQLIFLIFQLNISANCSSSVSLGTVLLENPIVLSAILISIKSPVASAAFGIAHFEPALSTSVANCLA